jgi:hypothetical protein
MSISNILNDPRASNVILNDPHGSNILNDRRASNVILNDQRPPDSKIFALAATIV